MSISVTVCSFPLSVLSPPPLPLNPVSAVSSRLALQDAQPPKTNNVLVKVLETQGEMMFSFGQATLSRGTLHLLPVEEAEPLVREGVVEVVGSASS